MAELPGYMTITEFANEARMSIRQLHRLRAKRTPGFPREYVASARPIFNRAEVAAWLTSRALW